MKTLVVFSVIRDEEFHIEMAIRSAIDRAYGVYIMDTGSIDNTVSIIKRLQLEYPNKIVLEEKSFGGTYRFDYGNFVNGEPVNYDEAKARNYGFKRAKEKFSGYDWILSMDGDEIVTDLMFDEIERVNSMGALQLGHAGHCPLTPNTLLDAPNDRRPIQDTFRDISCVLIDPHSTAWSRKLDIEVCWEWAGNHISHGIPDTLRVVTDEEVKMHLHYGFGPKSIHGWLCEWKMGIEEFARVNGIPREICYKQQIYEERYPDWFVNGRFTPKPEVLKLALSRSTPMKHPLPKFVLDKWNEWGDYELKG